MKNKQLNILIFFFISFVVSCSTHRKLIEKKKTKFGTLKFYVETNLKHTWHEKRISAKIDNSIYFFYPDRIIKELNEEERFFHSLIYHDLEKWKSLEYSKAIKESDSLIIFSVLSSFDNIEKWSDYEYYQKLNKTDSLILAKGNRILDSLKWNDFKRPNGAIGFLTEVY